MTQRRHESPALGSAIGRLVRALVRRAGEGDTEALEQLADLEELAGVAMTVALERAHHWGYSWTEVATTLGVSRQAVRQRAERPLPESARELGHWVAMPKGPPSPGAGGEGGRGGTA